MNICEDCPMRLFNIKHYNLHGIGNPYFGNCIVVPNVDYNAYKNGDMAFSNQVEIIKEVLHLSTGEGDLTNLYIIPLIRCNTNISCEITNDIYYRCLRYFKDDIIKYNFKRILLLGDACRRFLQVDITNNLDTTIISANNRFYNVNYSPLIKYTNKDKFEVFEKYLRKWFNNCINDNHFYKYYMSL